MSQNAEIAEIFVVSDDPLGLKEAERLFDFYHVIRGSHYWYFTSFDEMLISRLKEGFPQIVFILQGVDLTPALIAAKVKEINHKAIVCMLTKTAPQFGIGGSAIDASVVMAKAQDGILSGFLRKFLDAVDRTAFERAAVVGELKALG